MLKAQNENESDRIYQKWLKEQESADWWTRYRRFTKLWQDWRATTTCPSQCKRNCRGYALTIIPILGAFLTAVFKGVQQSPLNDREFSQLVNMPLCGLCCCSLFNGRNGDRSWLWNVQFLYRTRSSPIYHQIKAIEKASACNMAIVGYISQERQIVSCQTLCDSAYSLEIQVHPVVRPLVSLLNFFILYRLDESMYIVGHD